jgi:hypothetical protein
MPSMPARLRKLSAVDIVRIASENDVTADCDVCAGLICPGWESLPGSFAEANLRCIGTRWTPDEEEPTLAEHHAGGTRYWSAEAPIALEFHPYNRSELWTCKTCSRLFLRYTEYGGYYEDRRIRELNPVLIVLDVPV